MKSIQHLSIKDQIHFIRCDCGEYLDMRNLQEVFDHQHWNITPEVTWGYTIKIGDAIAYTKNGEEIKLN